MLVQGAVLVAFQSVKQCGRRLLGFREVDRTITVGIECLDRAGVIWFRRSWYAADEKGYGSYSKNCAREIMGDLP